MGPVHFEEFNAELENSMQVVEEQNNYHIRT
jgi:hypothetical protein